MDKPKIMAVEYEAIVTHDIARQLKDMGCDVVAISYSFFDGLFGRENIR